MIVMGLRLVYCLIMQPAMKICSLYRIQPVNVQTHIIYLNKGKLDFSYMIGY